MCDSSEQGTESDSNSEEARTGTASPHETCSQREVGPGELGLELSIVNERLRDLATDQTLPAQERGLRQGFYAYERAKLQLQIAILDKKERADSDEKARSELSVHFAGLERLVQEDSTWQEGRTAARRWELSRRWEVITPDELRPSVEAIRHSFEHKGCRQAEESTTKLCYAALHPSAPKDVSQTDSDDLEPHKQFLTSIFGPLVRPLEPGDPEPVIFKFYLHILIIALKRVVNAEFCELYDIAKVRTELLNMHPVEWAKRHIEILVSAQKYSARRWFRNVCDKPDWSREVGDDDIYWGYWRAPRLIHMRPAGNTPYDAANAWTREGLARSLQLLDVRADRLVTFVGFALNDVARAKHIEFVKEFVPRPPSSHRVGNSGGPTPPLSLRVKGTQSSEVWRNRHDKFRTLAEEELALAPRNVGNRWLRADVVYRDGGVECGQWHLSSGVSESFRERFEVEATRGGIAVNSTLAGEPVEVWLHYVFLDLFANKSKLLFAPDKDGGIIVRACEASAIYCARLEKKALIQGTKPASDPAILAQGLTAPSNGHEAATISMKNEPTEDSLREGVIRKVGNPQKYAALSIPEAVLYFDVKPRTIHRWTVEGKLQNGGRRGSITIVSIRRWQKKRSRKVGDRT